MAAGSMDHLMFLAQERAESFQVSLHAAASHFGETVGSWKDHGRSAITSSLEAVRNHRTPRKLMEKTQELLQQLKESLLSLKPREIYDRCLVFLFTEVTRTHLYFGGFCFVLGGLAGVFMGVRLRNSIVVPQKMRAVAVNNYSGIESIALVEDMQAPRIVDPDQVLVQVKAAGIDYLDIRISEGYGRILRRQLNKYNPNTTGEFPVVLGRDCSGVVVAVGKNVTKVEQGDEVWLAVPSYHQGTLSEYLVVSQDFVAIKPTQLSHEGAAALAYSIMIAWNALVEQAGLSPEATKGKRVLIHAGATGIGVVGLQLIHAWGGHVTTTVTTLAAPLMHMLGADDVITYDNSNFEKELLLREKYDVILNTVGPVLEESCLKHRASSGIVITTALPALASDNYGYVLGAFYAVYIHLKYIFTKAPWLTGGGLGNLEVSGRILEEVVPLIKSGHLQAVVDKAYSAQDAEVAFAHIIKGEQIGKTVVRFRARPLALRMDHSL